MRRRPFPPSTAPRRVPKPSTSDLHRRMHPWWLRSETSTQPPLGMSAIDTLGPPRLFVFGAWSSSSLLLCTVGVTDRHTHNDDRVHYGRQRNDTGDAPSGPHDYRTTDSFSEDA